MYSLLPPLPNRLEIKSQVEPGDASCDPRNIPSDPRHRAEEDAHAVPSTHCSVHCIWPVVLRFEHVSESPGGLVKMSWLGCAPRVSHSVGLGWGLGIHISNKSPDDADATGPRVTL